MIVPEAHMGACMELATQRRGIYRCKTADKPPTEWTTYCFLRSFFVYNKTRCFRDFEPFTQSLKVCSFILLRFVPGQPTS